MNLSDLNRQMQAENRAWLDNMVLSNVAASLTSGLLKPGASVEKAIALYHEVRARLEAVDE